MTEPTAASRRYPDEIWEHKRGRIWLLVKKLTQENLVLRYQVKALQARNRRLLHG